MLSAYRRSGTRCVLLANGSLKPRLFTSAAALRNQLNEAAVGAGLKISGSQEDATAHSSQEDRSRWSTEQAEILKQPFLLDYKASRESYTEFRKGKWEGGKACAIGRLDLRPGIRRVSGYIGPIRKVGTLLFAPLTRDGYTVQIVCSVKDSPLTFHRLRTVNTNSAIVVWAHTKQKQAKSNADGEVSANEGLELVVEDFKLLGSFPDDIVVGEAAKYGPDQRHLQLRFDEELRARITFRSRMSKRIRGLLRGFTEIDTPILFKSTPEGAREFLVPTRTAGMAYALPQSPQQYKQILMASGIDKYFQMAHCFRDEDLRADRQPEFMQLDLEMAFCKGKHVRSLVEAVLRELWAFAASFKEIKVANLRDAPFPVLTYQRAMSLYGTDKPDLRIKDRITQIQDIVPESLRKMMTSIQDPIIETFKFNLSASPSDVRSFVSQVMESPDLRPFHSSPDGPPGVFIYDPSKPLNGLHAYGHESAPAIEDHFLAIDQEKRSRVVYEEGVKDPKVHKQARQFKAEAEAYQPGDLIIMQARPNLRFNGGSTAIGRLRTLIHKAAVQKGYMTMPEGFEPLWVVDFPLFTPNNEVDPGQGGSNGFSATHHPFTSPKTERDVELCVTDPLEAVADHYDIVVNGVELGGGSARIHNAEFQEFVLRKVIGMRDERVEDFRHLLEALRAGCPPHAGLALGWDRLMAVMLGRESIRDVIAFPKDGKGKDQLVGSPTMMTESQQATYKLKVLNE